MTRTLILSMLCLIGALATAAQKKGQYTLSSPDGAITVSVQTGPQVQWSVKHGATIVLAPSPLSLTLSGSEVLGQNAVVTGRRQTTVNTTIPSPVYKKASVTDHYNQLALSFKGDYSIIFRAYNDGVAYRFVTARRNDLTVTAEGVAFNFDKDHKAFIPYVREPRVPGDKFITSFEALYDEINISQFAKDTLAFLPSW